MNAEEWMARALALAENAAGYTAPNPMVGAVIVNPAEQQIGCGWHHKAGMPHAEIEAIRNAGDELVPGCTIYVTLEPCCSHGRTPPCTEALIRCQFKKVVIGCLDPNPKHAGRGVEILRSAGIEVEFNVLQEECHKINEPFFHWITTGKPMVLLKMASTLDGKCATASGNSKWITGTAARKRVQKLRSFADAILVGGETYRLDDPQLTVRDDSGNVLRTPLRLVATQKPVGPGFERADLSQGWEPFLKELGKRNVMLLLIEGGGRLAGAALQAHAVDRIEFHYAPKILCGNGGRSIAGGNDPELMSEAIPVKNMEILRCGDDFIVTGTPDFREK